MPYPTETRTPMHCFLRIFDETSRAIRSCFVETLHKVVSLRGHDRLAQSGQNHRVANDPLLKWGHKATSPPGGRWAGGRPQGRGLLHGVGRGDQAL